MIVNEYDEKEFFDKSIKMLEKDYGNHFANDFKDIYLKQQKEIERLNGALQTHEILLKSNVLEIERLNNIINELEKYIKESCWKDDWGVESIYVKNLLNKLQELKGVDKE